MTHKRPTPDCLEVVTIAVEAYATDLNEWARSVDLTEAILPHVTLAVFENTDVWRAALYLHDIMDWSVNTDLLKILMGIYKDIPRAQAQATRAWVMANKVRFPAKEGQSIKFKIGPTTVFGQLVGVVATEARGFAVLEGKTSMSGPVPVMAEEVVEVVPNRPNSGGNYPTGGTPVASRPIVKKEAVA